MHSDHAEWDRLRQQTEHATVFSSPAYVVGAGRTFDLNAHLWTHNGVGVVLYEREHTWGREARIPPFTPYTPLLTGTGWNPAETHKRTSPLEALLEDIESRFAVAALHLQPGLLDVRLFSWRGWQVSPFFTYHVDLSGTDPPSASWSKNNRRDFLKQHTGFVFEESMEAIGETLRLSSRSYERHDRRFPFDLNKMQDFVENLHEDSWIRAFTARPQDKELPEAGVIVLHEPPRAAYWIAGSVPGPAMTMLVGHLLTTLHTEGYTALDFVGANTPSIAEFKRRFGSRLTPYFRVRWMRGGVPRLLSTLGLLR